MKNEVLTDETVKQHLHKYIFVNVDTDQDTATPNKWNLSLIPAHLIINNKEEKVKFKTGYMSATDYTNWMS